MKTLTLTMPMLLGPATVATAIAAKSPTPHNFREQTQVHFPLNKNHPSLHKRQPPGSRNNIEKKDATASHRSLAFIQGGPLAGQLNQTLREASGGVHLSFACTDSDFFYPDDTYCAVRNESIPVVWPVDEFIDILSGGDPNYNSGVATICPETTEECQLLENDLAMQSCFDLCKDYVELGGQCSDAGEVFCGSGHFCQDKFIEVLNDNELNGICTSCPGDTKECINDTVGGLTVTSKKRCFEACDPFCPYFYWGEFTIDDDEVGKENIMAYALTSWGAYSTPGSVYAPLVDCSDLVKDNVDTCPGANNSICLVHDFDNAILYDDTAQKCEDGGGVALVFYYQQPGLSDDIPIELYSLQAPANIPVVRIGYNAGKTLKENKLGSFANVTTYDAGHYCWKEEYCSTAVPCRDENQYCYFLEEFDESQGCNWCPDEPVNCLGFFPRISDSRRSAGDMAYYNILDASKQSVKSCASTCGASLEVERNCKMCGESITSFEFVDDPSDRCDFCPNEDVQYPDRIVPILSTAKTDVTCLQAQAFFSKVDVYKDSKNCRLAQIQNYICGCEGQGYAGANTRAKRMALVWAPRVTAILSGLGSLFVLVDVLKTPTRHRSLFHQLMAQMSIFDIIGSIAYAFTSLPIPSDYYLEGAKGTEATCKAQGYFIQLGTIACYTNVSLAFYYYFLIQKGWSDTRFKKVRHWFFICPMLVGLTFAFAGIPFYDNAFLWCNNTARWWPDFPVIVAILVATLVMGSVCYDVYTKTKASRRWQQQGTNTSNSLSKKFFWQSFWFLMAFYMTWPPYLALQYFWAAGKHFGNYDFILYAGTVVPMQGLWNFFVYARNRQLKRIYERLCEAVSKTVSKVSAGFSSLSQKKPQKKSSSPPTQTAVSNTNKSEGKAGDDHNESAHDEVVDVQAASGTDDAPGHPTYEEFAEEAQE